MGTQSGIAAENELDYCFMHFEMDATLSCPFSSVPRSSDFSSRRAFS